MKRLSSLILTILVVITIPALAHAQDTQGKTGQPSVETQSDQGGSSTQAPELSRDVISTPARAALGLFQLILTMALALLVIYISFIMIMKITRNFDDIEALKAGNTSVGILVGSFIFGVVILVKRTLYPAFAVINDLFRLQDMTLSAVGLTVLYFLGYLVVALSTALLIAIMSLKLFDALTKNLDEFEEIRNNNMAVALYFASICLGLCFFIEEGLHALLLTLLPLPKII